MRDINSLLRSCGVLGWRQENSANGEMLISLIPEKGGIHSNFNDIFLAKEIIDLFEYQDLCRKATKSYLAERENIDLKIKVNVLLNRIKDLEQGV